MSGVFSAGGLAHARGQRSADDHESECECQQAPSHPSSISNRSQGASTPDDLLSITEASRLESRPSKQSGGVGGITADVPGRRHIA
jgi:hypothetical protein